jgi:alpha-L-fucosidase
VLHRLDDGVPDLLKKVFKVFKEKIMSNKMIARPTPQQLAWHDLELEMFVHFDVAVWEGNQYGSGHFDLSKFNPKELDTEQWCDVAEGLGAKQIVYVAKHVSGFCGWQTQTTDYGVKNTPWRGGKGDIVKDLAESCRRRGLKLGIYLSPMDCHHGVECSGICRSVEDQSRYDEIYRRQLTELLTNYGPISELWFDGSIVIKVDDIIDKYAPGVICFQGPCANIRWPGTEKGVLPYPAWNGVDGRDAATGKATAVHGRVDGDRWLPMETDTTIRDHFWFWEQGGEKYLKSVDVLMDIYYQSVGYGGVLLLNSNPDTTGLIPQPDAARAAEFGAEIRRRFGKPLAETSATGPVVELDLGAPTTIDHIVLMEDIVEGERVYAYIVEGSDTGAGWREICRGKAIGHKKIDFFEAVTVRKLRFRCLESADTPTIRHFAAYHVGTIPSFDPKAAISIENPLIVATLDIQAGTNTLHADLSNACRIPQRYEIEICPENSDAHFRVSRATILRSGREVPGAVIPMSSDRVLDLQVTWRGEPTLLKLVVDASAGMKAKILVR